MAAEGSSHGATKRALEDKLFCPRQDSIEVIDWLASVKIFVHSPLHVNPMDSISLISLVVI